VFASQEELLFTVQQSSNQLSALIDQVLDLNRIEDGHLDLKVSDLSPKAERLTFRGECRRARLSLRCIVARRIFDVLLCMYFQ
jgi:signal transduction histidine kinase